MRGAISDEDLEALRRRAFGVAYRMLGSVAEAEDVAQEALLRLTREDDSIDEPAAWITTVATRLSINVLTSARVRRESYVGPWLPEPLVDDHAADPAAHAAVADSLSFALMVLLERLNPVERAVYLLREVFGYEYAQIAGIVDRSEANCRQIVTRSRKHIESRRPRFDPDEAARDALLDRFLAAAQEGDLAALEDLLAADAVLYADGGGKAVAAPEPLVGAPLIARFIAAVMRVGVGELESRSVRVNGQPGRVTRGPAEAPAGDMDHAAVERARELMNAVDTDATGLAALMQQGHEARRRPGERRVVSVLTVDVVDGRIQAVRIVRNPDKLAHL